MIPGGGGMGGGLFAGGMPKLRSAGSRPGGHSPVANRSSGPPTPSNRPGGPPPPPSNRPGMGSADEYIHCTVML